MIAAVVLAVVALVLVAGVLVAFVRDRSQDDVPPAHVEGGRSFPGGS